MSEVLIKSGLVIRNLRLDTIFGYKDCYEF